MPQALQTRLLSRSRRHAGVLRTPQCEHSALRIRGVILVRRPLEAEEDGADPVRLVVFPAGDCTAAMKGEAEAEAEPLGGDDTGDM